MKQYIKKNALPLAILALTVTVSLFVIAGRWQVEAANKTYDVILVYTELEWMAEQSDHDTAWWLKEFHDMGVSQVGLTEENLTTLMENSPLNVTATVMDEIMQDAGWREEYPEAFAAGIEDFGVDRFDVLVEAEGKEAVDFVVPALQERFPAESFFCYQEGDSAYILMDGTAGDALYGGKGAYTNTKNKGFVEREDLLSSKLMYVSLGLMPEKVEAIQAAGMAIVPRTLCYAGHNDTRYAQASVAGYEKHGITPAYIIAGGEALLGYDEGGDFVRDYMERTGASLGMIETNVQRENIKQTGVEETAQATGCNAVRVFSMWDYVQYRYAYYGYEGAEEVANCIYRAIVERNIRAVYFKMVKATDDLHVYITDPEVYRDLFDSLDQRLAAHGISRGRASVMEDYQVPSLALLAVGLGAGVGGALLPDTFLPMKRKWTLLLTGAAVVCVAGAWKVLPNSFRLLASFASAVVFACLAAAFFLMAAKRTGQKLDQNAGLLKILPRSIAILAIAVAISMAGAMMTAAPLSSTGFMLEMGIFRGVKAAQLLPLAFFCLLFVSYYGLFEKDRKNDRLDPRDIFTALGWTIPMWAVLLMAVVGLAGYYYLARTGHETGVTISDTEMIFRNDLEYLLLARPRTKEFLVAFPGIMLAVYCAVRRLPFWTALFGLAGTIGLTSVCNTFMHIRTPLYLGFARTAYSLVLGLVVGAVFTGCFELLYRLFLIARKKYIEAEQK